MGFGPVGAGQHHAGGLAETLDELLGHLRPDLEGVDANARPDGGKELCWFIEMPTHFPHRVGDHAADHAAPAGMNRGDGLAGSAGDQDRTTVRRSYADRAINWRKGDQCIGFDVWLDITSQHNLVAMDLRGIAQWSIDTDDGDEAVRVFRHGLGFIAIGSRG